LEKLAAWPVIAVRRKKKERREPKLNGARSSLFACQLSCSLVVFLLLITDKIARKRGALFRNSKM